MLFGHQFLEPTSWSRGVLAPWTQSQAERGGRKHPPKLQREPNLDTPLPFFYPDFI
jgi:hypothetical protein